MVAVVHNEVDKVSKQKTVVWICAAHFFIGLLVLLHGMFANEGIRKYVPLDPSKLSIQCNKAFGNVLASSVDQDDLALVCCGKDVTNSGRICSKHRLPLDKRLTYFPDAWLLPLIPWTLSFLMNAIQSVPLGSTMRRLCLYFLIMNVRGWILFVSLNWLESKIMGSGLEEGTTCWYSTYLKASRNQMCYAERFDFSDHVVLFYVQYLPILFLEVLANMKWWITTWNKAAPATMARFSMLNWAFSVVFASFTLYFYLIVLQAAHKTSTYFHTPAEVALGYLISLFVQLPVFSLACKPEWKGLRSLLGLDRGD